MTFSSLNRLNIWWVNRFGAGRREWRRAASARAAAAALVLLAACGGGTTQYEVFVPGRLFAFGDDASALTADGRKYAVNGLNADGLLDCTLEPLWVQSVAVYYGFVFAQCNPNNSTAVNALMFAAAGARVAEIAAQVDTQVAAGGFRDKDLALVLGGANDVYELYAQFPQRSEAQLIADVRARGERLAQIVNRLVTLQAKVIVSTLPDLGLSPYARAQEAANAGRAGLITRLTSAFNEQMGLKVLADGRFVGLMQTDLRSQLIERFPGSYPPLSNTTTAACTAVLPSCTTATLITDATAGAYFWADDKRLSSGAQIQLASLALERAQRNPF